jgi:predicted dehydrogenase
MPETLPRRTLEVQGTGGTAVAQNTMGQEAGGTLELVSAKDGVRRPVEVDPAKDRSPFLNQVEAFAEAVLADKPFPFPPERDLHTMRVLAEALEGVAESLPTEAR